MAEQLYLLSYMRGETVRDWLIILTLIGLLFCGGIWMLENEKNLNRERWAYQVSLNKNAVVEKQEQRDWLKSTEEKVQTRLDDFQKSLDGMHTEIWNLRTALESLQKRTEELEYKAGIKERLPESPYSSGGYYGYGSH
jgi:chromosome segregation ATPase